MSGITEMKHHAEIVLHGFLSSLIMWLWCAWLRNWSSSRAEVRVFVRNVWPCCCSFLVFVAMQRSTSKCRYYRGSVGVEKKIHLHIFPVIPLRENLGVIEVDVSSYEYWFWLCICVSLQWHFVLMIVAICNLKRNSTRKCKVLQDNNSSSSFPTLLHNGAQRRIHQFVNL